MYVVICVAGLAATGVKCSGRLGKVYGYGNLPSFIFHVGFAECPHSALQIIIENETCLSHAAVNYNVRLTPQFSVIAAILSLNDFCEVHASNHGHAVRPLAAYARTVRARAMSASLCPGLTTSGSTKGPDGGSTTALTDSHSEGAKRDRFRTNSFLISGRLTSFASGKYPH